MSGSSGTGFSGSGSGSGVACEDITIQTQLASPKANVVVNLKIGDILEISSEPNSSGQPLLVAKFNGQIAGGITHPVMFKLMECINQGTSYLGEVLFVNVGIIKIKIFARR